jgi:TPR repeat protein
MGRGVTKDDVAAYAWYSEAAASGLKSNKYYCHGNARNKRDRIKRDLTPSQLEKGQVMAREISERIAKRKAAKAE